VGGIPSVVRDGTTGLLVDDPLDVDGAVKAVSTLLEAPDLRKRLGQNGRDPCVAEFGWGTIAGRVEDALTQCAGLGKTGLGAR
jgi:glycosyltransferase involved in cell wall biosynthesis